MNWWQDGREVDSERVQLARKQFDFYSEDLKLSNPFSSANDAPTVDRSRRYLAQFSGTERVYQFMLTEASRRNPSVNFNQRFPGSAETVTNNRDVVGAFTKAGWGFMQNAIKHADQYFGGEKWVLGDYAPTAVDRGKLETELTARYTSDFINAWRNYFAVSRVNGYANLKDAARKLGVLSGNQSTLLALFWLASQNTGVDSPKVLEAFQPVHQVVPPAQVDRYIGPTNQPYMNSLLQLQGSIEQVANAPTVDPNAANMTLQNAQSAKMGTKQVAQGFRIDPEAHLETKVEKLLEEPITNVEALLRGLGPAELNAKGRGLCAQFSAVFSKFPFNPKAQAEASLDEVGALLKPQTGSLWAFYEANLKSALQRQGNQFVPIPGGTPLNPNFVAFMNAMARFSDAIYHGGQTARLEYTLQPLPSEQLQGMTIHVDGQNAAFSMGGGVKKFFWPGTSAQELRLAVKLAGGSELEPQQRQGLWSVFRFFADADRFSAAGSGFNLEWIVRQGREGHPVMVGGKPLMYRFYLDTMGAPPVFSKDYLAGLRCVATIAK
jgi:type VI secretion system protein ImpL